MIMEIIAEHKKTGIKASFYFTSISEAKVRNPDFKNWHYKSNELKN